MIYEIVAYYPFDLMTLYSKIQRAEIFCIRHGEYQLYLDGEIVRATFNSRGAAMAAIPVERARRKRKAMFKAPTIY